MASTNLFDPYEAEREKIARRRKLAEALLLQSQTPMGGTEYAGGIAIRRSPLEGVAKIAQAYSAKRLQDDTDTETKRLQEQQRGDIASAIEDYTKATTPRPAEPAIPEPSEEAGGGPGRAAVPAFTPDATAKRTAAMSLMGRIGDPRDAAKLMVADALKAPAIKTVDLGNMVGVMDQAGNIIAQIPKGATPDTQLREQGANARHQAPSGSSILGAQTTMRGQDLTDARTRAEGALNRGVSLRGQNLSAETTRRGQDMSAETQRAAQAQAADAALQATLAEAKAGGKERGEATAQAAINLPNAVAKAEQAVQLIDQMIGSEDKKVKPHAGFQSAVGATLVPGARFVEGSDTASFMKLLDQVKGGAFLQAFETLKGGGQITEVEGKKATDAITRMDKAQSEAEFIKSAREFQDVIRAGVERAKQKAGADRRSEPRTATQRIVVDY